MLQQLKEILGDLFTPEIEAKLTASGKKILLDDKNFVPLSKLDEANEKVKTLKTQIEQYDTEIKQLKKLASGNDELVGQIESLQNNAKQLKADFEKKEQQLKKDLAIKEALLNAGVEDVEARNLLAPKFSSLELDGEGKLKNFEETLKPIKENKAFSNMFGKVVIEGDEHNDGKNPLFGEYANKNPFSRSTLNIAEQVRLLKEQPELAKKLQLVAQ